MRSIAIALLAVALTVALAVPLVAQDAGPATIRTLVDAGRAHMKEGDPTQINLPKPVPIMIIYSTASAGENGEVRFFEDIYGHDETLENALAAGYPYPA
jgi:murein L,D-transpeptidase YcbB/YkuD